MKHVLLVATVVLNVARVQAQSIEVLKAAINDPQKSVQAIHHYPKSVKDGECHHVEVTEIIVVGSTITIVEQWKDWKGSKAKTTLTGQLVNNVATGKWESGFSSGEWSYNFFSSVGTWNKTKSIFDKFKEWEKIEFKVVDSKNLKDGFFACTIH